MRKPLGVASSGPVARGVTMIWWLRVRRALGGVSGSGMSAAGTEVDTTLDRVTADDLAVSLPVREFRWYQRAAGIIRAGTGRLPSAVW
jgi:hypothetical protein